MSLRNETETITYLEMTDPSSLKDSLIPDFTIDIQEISHPDPAQACMLYTEVGKNWLWIDRLSWDYARWSQHYQQIHIFLWIGYVREEIAGYFELAAAPGGSVEIAYFGLMPEYIGQGLGGTLLYSAIKTAWQLEPQRVWVHTSSRDHPNALRNYQARGFRIYKQETVHSPVEINHV